MTWSYSAWVVAMMSIWKPSQLQLELEISMGLPFSSRTWLPFSSVS